MFIKNWKKEILTIPNLLSLFRLILIPIYTVIYMKANRVSQYLLAGTILMLSCLTDLVDGRIARQFHMTSTLGQVMDPFADKATQLTLTYCLSRKYAVLQPMLLLLVLKESFQLIAAVAALRNGKMLPGALPAGKVCTTILFSSLILLVFFPDLPIRSIHTLAAVDTVFLIYSFLAYIQAYYGKDKKTKELPF